MIVSNMPEKVDLARELSAEYSQKTSPHLVHVSGGSYLTVVGTGSPDGHEFEVALNVLLTVAYTVKMASKRSGRDYRVMPLEGTWWTAEGTGEDYAGTPRELWQWKLMIRVPDFISETDLAGAWAELVRKKRTSEPVGIQLEHIDEGDCVQALHVGPYSTEAATLAAMSDWAAANDRRLRGHHHEIYLSDPRRVPPERRRTILRHPLVEPGQPSLTTPYQTRSATRTTLSRAPGHPGTSGPGPSDLNRRPRRSEHGRRRMPEARA